MALLRNATEEPPRETPKKPVSAPAFPSTDPLPTLTRAVKPLEISWRKTSLASFRSFATRFEAALTKEIHVPSGEIVGMKLRAVRGLSGLRLRREPEGPGGELEA